ncbi:glutaredoxin-like protein [Wolffia australiana]
MVRSAGDGEDQGDQTHQEIEQKIRSLQKSEEFSREEDSDESDSGSPISWSGDSDSATPEMIHLEEKLVRPSPLLPQPEKPLGITGQSFRAVDRSLSDGGSAIGRYIKDRSSLISSAFARRISSLKEPAPESKIQLSGFKVTVMPRDDLGFEFEGRISFFSRSGCRDCTAVRGFFRERRLPFVEINVDVYPSREKELVARGGCAAVPQIFFNDVLVGGLVALNSLRNSGEFDRRLRELAGGPCPSAAPRPPVYGFDDDDDDDKDRPDALIGIVRVLRRRLPIQDRLSKVKLVKNCFSGSDLVETIIDHLDCGRKRAVEIGRELCRKHFIHHVSREKEFEDGPQLYRLLEHDPAIVRCFNFRKSTKDSEPKPALVVGRRLNKLMTAILESYASDDRRHLDYALISASEEFRRYVNLVEELQRVDLLAVSEDQLTALFLNLYNAMVIHAIIKIGRPENAIERRSFFGDFFYIVSGHPFSLAAIKNGILRGNRRQPYTLAKPFGAADQHLKLAVSKVDPLVHFGLCEGSRSGPVVRFFSGEATEMELRNAAREFFRGSDSLHVDLEKRTVYVNRIFKWYDADFGDEKEMLTWVLTYLDPTKAGLLTHLQRDGGPVHIAYQDYDWALNS